MKIEIKRLELTNFKCFRHKEISFDSSITTIRGRNGVGKTTIADAILWCLFGKNSAGQSDFDLKTHNADGRPIPNLDHSVELHLATVSDASASADSEITIKRTLKETWVKKRGSEEVVFKNNTTEYTINGQDCKAADFKKFISDLVNEDTFRAITSPTHFCSLPWKQQREFLTGLVDTSDMSATKEELDGALASIPAGQSLEEFRKHLSYQIKGIKDRLDKIPVRLEEQNKALPEKQDWDALQMELENTQKQLSEVEAKILTVKSGNGSDLRKAEIRAQIDSVRQDIHAIEDNERISYRTRQQEHDDKIAEAQRKFNSLLNTQKDLEAQISSFDTLAKRCQETLDQCEKDAEKIREEWAHNLSRTRPIYDNERVCPTCGQYLPEEQVAEKHRIAEENLNADKARVKAELTDRADKVKATRAEAEKELQGFDDTKAQAEKNLADTKEQINAAFSDKAKLEKEPVLSFEQALADNVQYVALSTQLKELQTEYDSVGIDTEATRQLSDLEAQKVQYAAVLQQQTALLATRTQYDKILALIDGINSEQRDLVRQLSELERKEDVCRAYQDRMNKLLEERVNRHFSLVQWRMFRTVNNGGDPFDEPFCECYVDGVAYHDGLNQAARLNAGLDIINTLCRHYNVSAPIVLDNAESTLDILRTVGQQIRLEVADSDLKII